MFGSCIAPLLTVAIATNVYAAKIRNNNGNQSPTLLDTVNSIVINIKAQQTSNDTVSTTPAPIPGKLNVCEDLCPKWCQKVEGLERNFSHCHYLCGNLCERKTRINNPFIGNARYEVVPSEFEFAKYDLNEDKQISIEEFARVEEISTEEAWDLFSFSDLNNDGFIDTDEFHGSPLVFTVQMAAELSSLTMSGSPKDTSVQ